MLKNLALLGSIVLLSSCAYTLDKQIQDITVVTPGAENTVCYVYVDGLRYKLYPPQTVNITKSREDLVVDCLAPQNRRRKVIIEPVLSKHMPLNVMNGVIPGTAWDVASNSAFTYPEVITVDFTSAVPVPEAPPAQNKPDIRQPEEYDLEEFTSGLPRLNLDRNAVNVPLQRNEHGKGASSAPSYTEGGITPHTGPGKPADKADLGTGNVMDGLTTHSSSSGPAVSTVAPESTALPSASSAPPGGVSIAPYPLQAGPSASSSAGEKLGPPIPLTPAQ